jgi:superfamily II DNA or RNA helicase
LARLVRLRPWQKAALDAFWATPAPDFLAVATPGAGKTTFALTAARQVLAQSPGRLVVVAPTQHLKFQWARAAAAFDLHLDPEWSSADGRLPADMHGVVTTYQQVATSAPALRLLAPGSLVVFDELHHAGDERAWGAGIKLAFEPAARRLALSGTPFRSDTVAIPFVRYVGDEARPDYEYGYGEALTDGGVVRPVYFPRIDGHMEWMAPDGSLHAAGFADLLDRGLAGQRLRTALSLDGDWLPAVLGQAHDQLLAIREGRPDAAGLVIAIDQEHARGIGGLLRRRFGVRATVVTSDDPTASRRIAAFAGGDDPWIVAVRMVSEGVDIPRLHVGVYATTTTTELFFRQAVGRIVRWTAGVGPQRAYLFIPDDLRLRAHAAGIAEQRRHCLARARRDDDEGADLLGEPGEVESESEQISLFAALSAVAVGEHRTQETTWAGDEGGRAEPDPTIDVILPPAPPVRGLRPGGGASGDGVVAPGRPEPTLRERKKALRDSNADRARQLARRTGLTHAQVNRELNRLAGIDRVTEATVDQLERRLRHAEAWLARG